MGLNRHKVGHFWLDILVQHCFIPLRKKNQASVMRYIPNSKVYNITSKFKSFYHKLKQKKCFLRKRKKNKPINLATSPP